MKKATFCTIAVMLCIAATSYEAGAQAAWPAKPVRLVLPFSAGGPADVTARLYSEALAKSLGQQVLIENRPGAGGVIGSDAVAKSPPDGYTFLLAGNGAITTPLLRAKMPYAEADLVPVTLLWESPSVVVVNPKVPAKNLKELQSFARAQANPITYATAGTGSTGHFVAEMLKASLAVPTNVIPYKSGSEATTAVIAGDVTAASEASVAMLPYVSSGKVRAIAVTSDKRLPLLPDVPTTAESGFAGVRITHWGGMYAPRGTPPAVIERIAGETKHILESEVMKKKLASLGYDTMAVGVKPFEEFIRSEKVRLAKIAQDSKMETQ